MNIKARAQDELRSLTLTATLCFGAIIKSYRVDKHEQAVRGGS